jgi:hypothetical protein
VLEAVLSTLLEVIEHAIIGAVGVLLGALELAGRGLVALVKWGRQRRQFAQLRRGGERRPLRAARLAHFSALRTLGLLTYGTLAGCALSRGWTARGALAGLGAALAVLLTLGYARRVRLQAARRPRIERLAAVAHGELGIPEDQGAAWTLSVRRWESWPLERPTAAELATWRARRRRLRLERTAALETLPALVRFRLPRTYLPSEADREHFAAHLRAATDLDWALRWEIPKHAVWAEVSTMPDRAPYPRDWPAQERPGEIPLAIRRGGSLVCWRPDADPMGAIAGKTGSGKSVALGDVIIGAGRAGWALWIVDGKRADKRRPLSLFRGRLGVRMVATEPADWWEAIEAVSAELGARKRRLDAGGSLAGLPRVLLILDELPVVLALEKGNRADVRERNAPRLEAQRKITELAAQGRGLEVHLWLAGQALRAVEVEGPLKVNLSARLVLRTTRTGSLQVLENTAAAGLPSIPGRAVWSDALSDAEHVQVLAWEPEELDSLLPLEVAELEGLQVPDDASAIIG